jgi:hypothetical protein
MGELTLLSTLNQNLDKHPFYSPAIANQAQPLCTGNHNTLSEVKNLMLVPTNINDYQTLTKACNQRTIAVTYNPSKVSLLDLTNRIRNVLKGSLVDAIALATHGSSDGKFGITHRKTVSSESLQNDRGLAVFFKALGHFMSEKGRLDLFGCDTGKFKGKEILLEHLERLIDRPIAFADHKVGSHDLGGDWILNQVFRKGKVCQKNIDLSKIYFNSKLLHSWSGIFPYPIDVGPTDRSLKNTLTDEPVKSVFTSSQELYATVAINFFGFSVSASTNRMVASGRGAIEFFNYTPSGWGRVSSISISENADDNTVVMWEDQNLAIMGYPPGNTAAGYLNCYQYNPSTATWSTVASSTALGTLPTLSNGYRFGTSLAAQGNFLVVGARGYATNTGRAYVYNKATGVWNILPQIAMTTYTNEFFGYSAAIDGNRIAVGQLYESAGGAVHIYDYNGISWVGIQRIIPSTYSARFGCSVDISGDRIAVGAYGDSTTPGEVFIFEKGLGSFPWVQAAKITPPDGVNNDRFGFSVKLNGNSLIVSSPNKAVTDSNGVSVSAAGQVYIFEKKANGWGLIKSVAKPNLDSATDGNIKLGTSLALNAQNMVIGIPYDNTVGSNKGKLLAYNIKDTATAFEHYDGVNFDVDQTSLITDGTGSATLLGGAYDVKVSGKYTYVISTTSQGLTVFDTSDPFNPVWKGQLSLGAIPSAFDYYGNYVYVSSSTGNWIRVINVTDPTNPTIVNMLALGSPTMVKVKSGKLFVYTTGDTSLRIYSLSTPNSPVQSSILTDPTNLAGAATPNGMCIEGSKIYIVNTGNKVTIIDNSGASPTYYTQITGVTATPQGLAGRNDHLYVIGNTGNSIQIYNVSNPASPVLVKTLSHSTDGSYLSGLTSISIEKDYAYVSSTSNNTISVIDIFDPPNASIVKEIVYNSNGITGLNGVKGIVVSNNVLYTADSTGNALSILKLHIPTKDVLTRVLRFDGSDQRVTIPSFTLSSRSICLEARFYLTFNPWGNTAIIDLANGANNDNILLQIPTIKKLQFVVYQGSTGGTTITSNATIELFTWYHVAVMVDSLGNVSMYINGVLDNTGNTLAPDNVTRTSNYIATSNWPSVPFFGGIIKEVRIWNGTRTQKQILANLRTPLIGSESGLIAYYPFNEEDGEIVYDMSQQKRNAFLGTDSTTTANPTRILANDPFAARYSLKFNGTTSYVSVPHDGSLNAYPLTISAWIKTSINTGSQTGIVSKYEGASWSGYQFHIYNGNVGAWYAVDASNRVYSSTSSFHGGFVADNQWHYVTFTVDSTGGKIYRDGTLISILGWTGTASAATGTIQNLLIGDYNPGGSKFPGEIAEVQIWNTALTQANISKYMQSSLIGSESNLVAYYKFSEGRGTTLTDLTTNGFNGTISNATWKRAPTLSQPIDQALYFNGTTSIATIPHATAFNSMPMTVAFWFQFKTTGASCAIVDKFSTGPNDGYHIFTDGSSGNWYLALTYYTPSGSLSNFMTLNTGYINDGRWRHVAFTVDTTGGICYVNGKQVSSLAWTGTPSAPTTTANTILGKYAGAFITGNLDDLSFWDRALTAQEIQNLAFKPISASAKGLVANYKFSEIIGQYIYDNSGNGYHGTLGASNSLASDDPLYTISLARKHPRYAVTSNKYAVITISTYDPDSNTYNIAIRSLPTQGTLYHYDATQPNCCGSAISLSSPLVTDSSKRVVYYPNMTGASSYDVVSFDYTCQDTGNDTSRIRCYINLSPHTNISGTVANQPVNDNATIQPFSGFKLAKVDLTKTWTYTVSLDDKTRGVLSGTIGSYNSTTGIYTLANVSPSVAEADIKSLVFTPRSNAIVVGTTETTIFTIACTDGSVSDSTTTVVTTSINDAPVLTAANPLMTTIAATNTTNTGQTVASILGTSVADVDFGAVEGVAITTSSITSGSGTWQYSLNGGTTWTAFGVLSNAAALLLRDTDRVRFLPDGTYQASGSFGYYAWDQTSGTAGSLANVTTRGGSTAFSTTPDTASITVTGLHPAWNITTTAGATSYVLANPLVIIDSGVAETDSATTVAGANIVIQITTGSHSKDTVTISSQGTSVGQINVVGNYVKYGSIIIGTYSGATTGSSALRITLNKNATQASINAVMRRISFYNSDTTATVGNRVVTYTYSDNSGTTHSATKTVSVTTTTPPPSTTPTPAIITTPTVTSVYNTLASANQYASSFSQISSYLRSFFYFR